MQKHNPAQRRYLARFFPVIGSYVAVLFATTWLIRHWHPAGVVLATLAVLPALPLVATIGVMGLYLAEERDEFLRQRLVIAMLIGLAALLALLTVWGFLANGGVADEPPTLLAFPVWCAFFGIAECALRLRDRFGGRA
jgi:hypothetical protein